MRASRDAPETSRRPSTCQPPTRAVSHCAGGLALPRVRPGSSSRKAEEQGIILCIAQNPKCVEPY